MKTASLVLLGIAGLCLTACEANPRYCTQTADCKDPAYPFCELPAKECVSSLPIDGGDGGSDMGMDLREADLLEPDLQPLPDLMPACTPATAATSCTVAEPVCDATAQTCRACSGDGDDAACALREAAKPYCLASSGACVGCRSDAQCTGSATLPVCELAASGATRNTCRGCQAHDECPSKLCNPDGSCEAAANIVYVNNAAPCTGTTHAGTLADPYCQIGDGIAGRASKQILRVLGSTDEYKVISITAPSATPLRIIGPGSAAATKATVRESSAVTLTLNVTGTINVSVVGLVLGSATTGTLERGVDCKGSGVTLSLQDVIVQKAGKEGVFADACALTVSQSTITGNTGGAGISAAGGALTVSQSTITGNRGGLAINTDSYQIANNLIVKNSGDVGVSFDGKTPLPASRFWFNTVARNGEAGVEGGINCGSLSGSNTRTIANSIVWNNTTAAGTQFNGDCVYEDTVAGTGEGTTATGLVNAEPSLTDGTSTSTDAEALRAAFSLLSSDTVCQDQVDAVAGFPTVDLFGTTRPQGTRFDIGAHEVVK